MLNRRYAPAFLALVLVALAGCGGSSEDKADKSPGTTPQLAQPRTTTTPVPKPRPKRRKAPRTRAHEFGVGTKTTTSATPPAGGATPPAPPSSSSGGAAPSVDTPQGKRDLQTSPDCAGHRAPPPGYHGPVQC